MEMIEKIRQANIPLFLDPASVGGMMEVPLTEVKSWLSMVDGILLNEEEAMYLTGKHDAVDALEELLLETAIVVIKRGSQGAIGKVRGSILVEVPALSTEVIDTTGAGDSFAAGFIASFAQTQNMQLSLEAGAKVAARCVAIVGARPRVGTVI